MFKTEVQVSTITEKTNDRINTLKGKQILEILQNLGDVDDILPKLRVQSSLLLETIRDGFADGFQSKSPQLHKREYHFKPTHPFSKTLMQTGIELKKQRSDRNWRSGEEIEKLTVVVGHSWPGSRFRKHDAWGRSKRIRKEKSNRRKESKCVDRSQDEQSRRRFFPPLQFTIHKMQNWKWFTNYRWFPQIAGWRRWAYEP